MYAEFETCAGIATEIAARVGVGPVGVLVVVTLTTPVWIGAGATLVDPATGAKGS